MLGDSAQRLRRLALLYAAVFFVAGTLPVLLVPEASAPFFSTATRWVPALLAALSVMFARFLSTHPSLGADTILVLGHGYQVLGSLGIACTEYLGPTAADAGVTSTGLSWVAVWVLSFALTVPSRPAWVLCSTLVCVSTVPLTTGMAIYLGGARSVSLGAFLLNAVLPYLILVPVTWFGADITYRLRVDLKQALDLGSYTLVERLGVGGMGEVWRARHRLLARPAAVKLIRREVALSAGEERQRDLRARFEREAQTTAALQSPHTVTLYDYGVTEGGSFYYVMELLDGFDLRVLVTRFGPLPAGRAVHLLTQICRSLAEAHEHGLVHRDITPANIFVCRYGLDTDFVKVLDFGLVRPDARWDGMEPSLSRGAHVGGTPAFMAPEQAIGHCPIDARADLYAVGCVAYWLLTGTLVFQGNSPTALAVAHAHTTPDPLSTRTELPIPPALEALVIGCLAKAPGDRPPTASALADRLEALQDVPRWTRAEAHAWWSTHVPRASQRCPTPARVETAGDVR